MKNKEVLSRGIKGLSILLLMIVLTAAMLLFPKIYWGEELSENDSLTLISSGKYEYENIKIDLTPTEKIEVLNDNSAMASTTDKITDNSEKRNIVTDAKNEILEIFDLNKVFYGVFLVETLEEYLGYPNDVETSNNHIRVYIDKYKMALAQREEIKTFDLYRITYKGNSISGEIIMDASTHIIYTVVGNMAYNLSKERMDEEQAAYEKNIQTYYYDKVGTIDYTESYMDDIGFYFSTVGDIYGGEDNKFKEYDSEESYIYIK